MTFEQWLIREEGILKVEKEVDEWCENDVFVDELYKRYRQLEKDNEKLKVLQDINADTINNYAEASINFQKIIEILSETKTELLAALDGAISIGRRLISQVASHIHVERTKYYHKQLDILSESLTKYKED